MSLRPKLHFGIPWPVDICMYIHSSYTGQLAGETATQGPLANRFTPGSRTLSGERQFVILSEFNKDQASSSCQCRLKNATRGPGRRNVCTCIDSGIADGEWLAIEKTPTTTAHAAPVLLGFHQKPLHPFLTGRVQMPKTAHWTGRDHPGQHQDPGEHQQREPQVAEITYVKHSAANTSRERCGGCCPRNTCSVPRCVVELRCSGLN